MNIYALLVGIDDYPRRPLNQCVHDVKKMESYLKSLENDKVKVKIMPPLLNKEGTKKNILAGISEFLSQATDKDVALFYYSGHGAHEAAADRFPDEPDNLLECIVCYYDQEHNSNFLLADKELRYQLYQLPNTPHLVTVFDCCHSGDMVREELAENQLKRIVKAFPARLYEDFIFQNTISEADLKNKATSDNFPFKNHVHLAACDASQSSWEDRNGGVFTRYLLTLLEAKKNKLSYKDIARWSKISLRDITEKKQSPTLSIQGEGTVSAFSPWLNLHPQSELNTSASEAIYNKNNGWYLTLGSIMGIKNNMEVIVDPKGKNKSAKVFEVGLTDAKITDPFDINSIEDVMEKTFPVVIPNTYASPIIYVNNIDGTAMQKKKIRAIIRKQLNIKLGKASEADFFINIFNELVYISQAGDPYRPLGRQIYLIKDEANFKNLLIDQLQGVIKWYHFYSLENPHSDFDTPPIKIELKIDGSTTWHDLTNTSYELDAHWDERFKKLIKVVQIRVQNISEEHLYVGVLSLQSDFGISSGQWDQQVVALAPGEHKFFYDHNHQAKAGLFFESYKEIYNWHFERLHYKFIINNYEDFSADLPDFLQPNLEPPMVISKITKNIAKSRGTICFDAWNEVVDKWGTVTASINLKNPNFNTITSDLELLWQIYRNNAQIGPFIDQLYPEETLHNFN